MKVPGLEAFVTAIERHLSTRRGKLHVLSPPDFGLAREWHGAGVPLAAVLAAIDQAFADGKTEGSLQACRPLVSALALPTVRAPAPRDQQADPGPPDLKERLAGLEAALLACGRTAAFERTGRRLRELIDLTAVAREPNWSYLRDKLEELDDMVEQAALDALLPAEADAFATEAAGAAQRQQGRVTEEALEAARRRYLRRRARARFSLPRVSGD